MDSITALYEEHKRLNPGWESNPLHVTRVMLNIDTACCSRVKVASEEYEMVSCCSASVGMEAGRCLGGALMKHCQ